jgi:hypothetical protein
MGNIAGQDRRMTPPAPKCARRFVVPDMRTHPRSS